MYIAMVVSNYSVDDSEYHLNFYLPSKSSYWIQVLLLKKRY